MLALLTHACKDKNDDCYYIRKHLEQFLCFNTKTCEIVVGVTKSTEKECTDNSKVRLPKSEDNERYRRIA